MDIKQLVRLDHISCRPDEVLRLQRLAELFGISFPNESRVDNPPFMLTFRDGRLKLFEAADTSLRAPVFVDFCSGPVFFRYCRDRRINQHLAKAVGVKPGYRPLVFDATAGFGEDGFILASLGCRVDLFERSPIIWALLEDGIRRASLHPDIGPLVTDRMTLHLADSHSALTILDHPVDAVFIDPMYPPAQKSALNKKRMRLLRQIVGVDSDSDGLLCFAKQLNATRISVKRPLHAPHLSSIVPSFSIRGKSNRFDVYIAPYLW